MEGDASCTASAEARAPAVSAETALVRAAWALSTRWSDGGELEAADHCLGQPPAA